MVEKKLSLALILEDDVKFVTSSGSVEEFRTQLEDFIEEFLRLDGDLLYLGRDGLKKDVECKHCRRLVKPSYSYGAYAYMLSLKGARKLLNTDVLTNMIAVDEYLPLMFDQNPRFHSWSLRKDSGSVLLDAYSAPVQMVEVAWYMICGTKWFVSDTEESVVINETDSVGKCDVP